MREIKFRAWNKKGKYMTKNIDASLEDGFLCYDEDNFILMQYTDLKDKNSKEIYEGDIIMTNQGEFPFVVVFMDGSFIGDVTRPLAQFFYEFKPREMRNVEVIGNIYENPELLKQKC